jgi:hypothetical protein
LEVNDQRKVNEAKGASDQRKVSEVSDQRKVSEVSDQRKVNDHTKLLTKVARRFLVY